MYTVYLLININIWYHLECFIMKLGKIIFLWFTYVDIYSSNLLFIMLNCILIYNTKICPFFKRLTYLRDREHVHMPGWRVKGRGRERESRATLCWVQSPLWGLISWFQIMTLPGTMSWILNPLSHLGSCFY